MGKSRKKSNLPEWYKNRIKNHGVKTAQWLLVGAVVMIVLGHASNLVARL